MRSFEEESAQEKSSDGGRVWKREEEKRIAVHIV